MKRSLFAPGLLFAFLLLVLSGSVSVHAEELSAEDSAALKKEIETMMAEFEAGKTENLLAKTHTSLVEMMGGREKLTEVTNQAVASMSEMGMKFHDSELGDPTELYAAGDEVITFVPRVSTMEVQGQKVKSTGFMIAIRPKDGGDWSFLDGSGLRRNPEMLWTLFPDLTREIVLPPNKMEPIE